MKKGFTLLELLIVIIIIGVLAALAFPQYIKATERAKGGKARNALALISKAEKMYRADNTVPPTDEYTNVLDGAFDATLGSYIELIEVDADLDWNYDVSGASGTTFLATATRASGANIGETISVSEIGVWGGTFTP